MTEVPVQLILNIEAARKEYLALTRQKYFDASAPKKVGPFIPRLNRRGLPGPSAAIKLHCFIPDA